MKRILWITLALALLLTLCCGAAVADGTQQIMLGGDVLTKGAHFVMAGTNWDVLRNSTNTYDTAGRLAISSYVKNRTRKKIWTQQMMYIDSFYESEFSAGEKEAVMYTNKSGSNNDELEGAKLFALSRGEVLSYFSTRNDCRPGEWWLRTKITESSTEIAYLVDQTGDLSAAKITSMEFGVRPAFNLDLSKVLFASATDGGKSIAVEEGVVYSIPAAGGNEWKLTLLDESRNGFASSAIALTGLSGGAVMIPYSGAQTGSNEYVSILLCDSAGEVKGYGSCPVSGADGTACFVLPSGLPAGSYTVKLFNEQKNESMKSDLAGAPETLTLTVCAFEGTGQPDDPYLLKTGGDWDDLAAYVAGGVRTEDLCFRLNASISTSAMLGTQANPFAGTFDGGGKTLTVNLEASENITAPFRYIHNATIKNLRTAGSISVSDKRASGLIGENSGTSTVTNCRVSAEISGSQLVGGFSIGTGGTLNIVGSVFDGKITGGPNQSGCFVAWGTSGLTIADSMAAPQSGTAFTGGTFCYEGDGAPTLTNCYYLTAPANVQGQQAHSVSAGEGVTVSFGTQTAIYSVSGIAAYPTGLVYEGVFHAGPDEAVTLSLSSADPSARYFASAGTLIEANGAWTLTMPDEDVTISAVFIPAFGTPDFTLPAAITTVEEEAFMNAGMSVVLVPATCTSIGVRAFKDCPNLTQIRIPEGCAIGTDAFEGCTQVFVYSTAGSPAETYCQGHENCLFVEE